MSVLLVPGAFCAILALLAGSKAFALAAGVFVLLGAIDDLFWRFLRRGRGG